MERFAQREPDALQPRAQEVVVTDRIYRALVGLTQPLTQRGQGLAEYALILALIAIIAIVALVFLGGQTSKILSSLGNSI